MKNRAKCKKCESVIESFHPTDYVMCKCGEIAVDGGSAMFCYARDFTSFLRVDDQGNEVIVSVKEKATEDVKPLYKDEKPSKKELLSYLEEMIRGYENLPEHVKDGFTSNRDYESLLVLLLAILKAE
jgi:hypothetical protein